MISMTTQMPDALTNLINADRVRSSVRRLFQNDISECLVELFQNSQRARARKVEIETCEEGFTYRDDGHGLLGGVEGFHTLLKIAESHFDNETITDQDPMGLGIHALLAHDAIRQVTFASGDYRLSLDTKRWWADRDYYTRWFTGLEELAEPVEGFEVRVSADAKLIGELKRAFTNSTYPYRKTGPAEGYEGYLEITLDGARIETRLPRWARVEHPLIKTDYQGSRLTIGFDCEYATRNSSVNWYGQVIEVDFHSGFKFHLDVRQGRPVNPQSPTRRGIIKDAAYEALIRFVKDEIFRFVCDTGNRALVKPEYVSACFRMDAERARRESPYIVAAEMRPLDDPSSLEDIDCLGESELFTYDEVPRLLEEGVVVVLDLEGQRREEEHGLSSFIKLVGRCYALKCGDPARLKVESLWWKPGKGVREFFHEPGEWGIGAGDHPPTRWQQVDQEPVFSFTDASNWEVDSVDWTVGTNDIVAFLRNESWAGFDQESDEHNYEELQASYEESIERVLRQVIGNCVPVRFSVHELQSFMPTKDARIQKVRYHYDEQGSSSPQEITVTNAKGEEARLRLL
jgi:hypothetical protein